MFLKIQSQQNLIYTNDFQLLKKVPKNVVHTNVSKFTKIWIEHAAESGMFVPENVHKIK